MKEVEWEILKEKRSTLSLPAGRGGQETWGERGDASIREDRDGKEGPGGVSWARSPNLGSGGTPLFAKGKLEAPDGTGYKL